MDSSLRSQNPDNSDVKPSFRKLSNDTTNRKYRRHSPISGSTSSASSGSPKRDHSSSPNYSKEDSIKMSDDRRRMKDDKKDLDRDYGRSRSGKGSDSYRHSERQPHGSSRDYHRLDDHSRHHRHDDDGGTYQRSYRSGRESRSTVHSDYARKESDYDRSRENWWNNERYPRDSSDDRGHRNKDKDRETTVLEQRRHNDKDLSSNRSASGRRQGNSNMDENKVSEREKNRDRGGLDDRRDHLRSTVDYKHDNASSREEHRGLAKDLTTSRDSTGSRSKESNRNSNREPDRQKDDIQKRKHDDRERDRERDARNDKAVRVNEDQDSNAKKLKLHHSDKAVEYAEDGQLPKSSALVASEKQPSSSKQVPENVANLDSKPASLSAHEVDASNDLNAAKVAAMKAAELVNRNLVGGGYMTTDQKRKLLWGNKKSAAAEESGNRWGGMPLFSDRDRQEKFNKLMGVKGDLKLEHKADDKDGSSQLQAEKQEQLQLDLEKQYTAGLRRRDGRTVGLGL